VSDETHETRGKLISRAASAIGRNPMVAIFVLALALRIAAIAAIRNWDNPETWEPGVIAANLVAGRGFAFLHGPGALMSPGYPLLLAAAHATLGETALAYQLLQGLQAVAGAAMCVLAFHIGRELFDQRVGWLAAVGTAVYPTFIYLCTEVHPVAYDILIATALVLVVWRAAQRRSLALAGWAGVLAGVGALFRGAHLPAIFWCAAWLLWYGRRAKVPMGRHALVLLVVGLAIVAPWSIRSTLVLGRFTLVGSNFGYNLWKGNHEHQVGSAYANHVRTPVLARELAEAERRGANEAVIDRIYAKHAAAYVRNHPREALCWSGVKLLYHWTWDPYHPKARHPLYRAPYIIALLLFLPGVYLSRKRLAPLLLPYGMAVCVALESAVITTLPRYRMPFEVFMIMLGSLTVGCIWGLVARKGSRALWPLPEGAPGSAAAPQTGQETMEA